MKKELLMLYAAAIIPVMIACFCFFGRYDEKYMNFFAFSQLIAQNFRNM